MGPDHLIGIDVGGTTIKGVLVTPHGRVLAEHRSPTPAPDPSGERVSSQVAETVSALRRRALATRIGVALPGIVDEDRGRTIYSANLGWTDLPFVELLEDRIGAPIVMGHDVRCGALAEVTWGAAAGAQETSAFVAVGTGIGAGIVVDGRAITSGGFAGEIGQLVVSRDGTRVRLEDFASASAIARRAGLSNAREVAEAVRREVPSATEVWRSAIDALADAMAALACVVAPRVIIIGGGLSLAGSLLLDPLRAATASRLGPLRPPQILSATLGDRAAALGAAVLASHEVRV